jgi:hypothetical protein
MIPYLFIILKKSVWVIPFSFINSQTYPKKIPGPADRKTPSALIGLTPLQPRFADEKVLLSYYNI